MIKNKEALPLIFASIAMLVSAYFLIQEPDKSSSNIEMNIMSPINGEVVPINVNVSGTTHGKRSDNQYFWLLVHPHSNPGLWWPQGRHLSFSDGLWNGEVAIGTINDSGVFDIAVVMVNEQTEMYFLAWNEKSKSSGDWPGIRMPPNAKIMDQITIKRG
jgi:hypothetical protein